MRKLLPVLALAALSTACSSTSNITKNTATSNQAESKNQLNTKTGLPTEEKAFVKAIKDHDRKSIIAHFGEPAKADDVKIKGTDKIVASIWHYHYVNTDESGKYYETTELDFIENKVVQVVFLNNDGSEEAKGEGQSYQFPENESSH